MSAADGMVLKAAMLAVATMAIVLGVAEVIYRAVQYLR
jgi:hypothetical protein